MGASIIEAAKKFKATGFPPEETPGLSVSGLVGGSAARTVNQYFSSNAQLSSDCAVAGLSVLEKGLLDVVGSNLFDRISSTPDGGSTINKATREDFTENMYVGDMVQFPNYDDWELYHPHPERWLWRGENVVKVEENQFWGYVGTIQYTAKTKQEWNDLLREAYNKLNGPKRQG